MRIALTSLAVAIVIAGCGYKGPLYLPKPKPVAQKPAATTSAAPATPAEPPAPVPPPAQDATVNPGTPGTPAEPPSPATR